MNPMTAVGFLLAAASLWLFAEAQPKQIATLQQALGRLCASLVIAIGLVRLIAIFAGWDLGVDQWLFRAELDVGPVGPNRIAPNTALNFVLLGCALLALHSRSALATVFTLVSGFESLLVIIGYLYSVNSFYEVTSYIPMAFHTAVSFLVLAVGILACQTDRGLLGLVMGSSAGGIMAKRLLPAALLVPVILGSLRLIGQRLGAYEAEFGIALFTVANMFVLAALVCGTAVVLSRTDLRRKQAETSAQRAHDELEERVKQRTEELSGANAALREAHAELEQRVRQRTETIAEKESRLQSILDNTTAVIFVKDTEGRYLLVNKQFEKVYGYSKEEIIGKPVFELFPKAIVEPAWANDLKVLDTKAPLEFEEVAHHKDGLHTYIAIKFPLFDSNGNVCAVCGISTDITERKRGEDEVRKTQQFLDSIVENIPNMIFVKDAKELRFARFNKAGEDLLGVSRDQVLGKTDYDLFPDEDAGIFTVKDRVALESGKLFDIPEEQIQTKRGLRLLHTKKIPILDQNGEPEYLLGVSTDITERKRAEDALIKSKNELEAALHTNQLIMDNSRDVICTADAYGNFRTVSAASEKLWGYKPEELEGKPYIDLVHPDDREKTVNVAAQIMVGGSVLDFENRYIRKDGSIIHVMWSAYWSDADNMMFAVAHDITERARNEQVLRRAKDQADRANRAKSEFLSRMSHELRTPLNAILGFAQLLELDELSSEQRDAVTHILRGGRHLLNLINEVLDLSRIEAGRLSLSPEAVQVSHTLAETLDLIQPLAAERNVRIEAGEECNDFIVADRQRLKQVLINLFSNAIKYNRPGGSVSVRCHKTDATFRIEIVDTGVGISEERLQQIFTPFERLGAEQGEVEGTGLGLAVAKRMTEAMGGLIGVTSKLGEGSTFWLEFALTQPPHIQSKLEEHVAEIAEVDFGDRRTVLYIEDNLSNLSLVESLMKRRPSIDLVAARDGNEGLKAAKELHPDLVLLDLNLPDMHGYDLLQILRSDPHNATTPVIVISADATARQRQQLLRSGVANYLSKPLDIKQFFSVVDHTLDRQPVSAAN
jgi:PAS domain S-box-containing protein